MKTIKINKLTEVNKIENDEILYFGKTKTELLKKYNYIYGMKIIFNQKYLEVENKDKYILLNKDFQEVLKYDYIYIFNDYLEFALNKKFYRCDK